MAAAVFGAAGLAALSGRIICGLVADRTGAKRTLVTCLALQAVAIAFYMLAHDLDTLYAVSVLLGFSYGGAMPLYAILVREHFPAKIMGSVFGIVAMIARWAWRSARRRAAGCSTASAGMGGSTSRHLRSVLRPL